MGNAQYNRILKTVRDRNLMIRSLDRSEFEAAVGVLASSFSEEPLFEYFLGADAQKRAQLLRGLMRGMLKGHAPFSEIDGAFDRDKLIGVAISIRPNHFPIKARTMLSMAMRFFPPALILAVTNPGILRLFRVASLMEKSHPKEPCYYLAFFGVQPASRDGGMAEKLARFVLARADRQKVGCYLDTAGRLHMRMCRFLGFEVRHEFKPFSKGPTCFGMWRKPRH